MIMRYVTNGVYAERKKKEAREKAPNYIPTGLLIYHEIIVLRDIHGEHYKLDGDKVVELTEEEKKEIDKLNNRRNFFNKTKE